MIKGLGLNILCPLFIFSLWAQGKENTIYFYYWVLFYQSRDHYNPLGNKKTGICLIFLFNFWGILGAILIENHNQQSNMMFYINSMILLVLTVLIFLGLVTATVLKTKQKVMILGGCVILLVLCNLANEIAAASNHSQR